MYYTVYKTINLLNGKEYVGFHKIHSLEDILYERSENGSIFDDGYLGSGKLMKKALEKYGPINMRQELILVTEDKKEAETLEREIVSREWVESDDNYNVSIGGNVCILFGKENGFYGKKHTPETITKIVENRNKTYEKHPYTWSKSFLVEDENVVFYNSREICAYFNIEGWFEVNKLVYEGVIKYQSQYLQQMAINKYLKRYDFLNDYEARSSAKKKVAELCSERFLGVAKSKEHREKISSGIKSWIKENPEKHQERMLKINKNPEKIEKTADKHRGMKRSEDAKRKMSEAKLGKSPSNKGKVWIHNKSTSERKFIEKDAKIPHGWESGLGKRK